MSLQLSAPAPFAATHPLDEFGCGEASLEEWIKRREFANQQRGASRTFVVADRDVSQNAGVRALLVHAIDDRAKQFYEHYGFLESPQHPMTLMLRLSTLKA